MGDRLQGKVAIVTGAGRGIGRAEALALAAEGAKVVVNDLGGAVDGTGQDHSPADQVVAEIKAAGGEAVANYEDVTSFAGGKRMVQQTLNTFGRLDILVNNAGNFRPRSLFDLTEEDWDTTIDVHMKGHFTVTKAAAEVFRQQKSGRIVNTASEAGLGEGTLGVAAYGAAKEGIAGLTRTLALELGQYGVTANAIRPRAATRMAAVIDLQEVVERARASSTDLPSFMKDIPAHFDALKPELIAPLVVYLCTDAASHINGRDFIVGGGEIISLTPPQPEAKIYSEEIWTVDRLEKVFPIKPKS
jgi:3-oxoacyl-[acyl-carrier protein] reductase